MSSKQSGRRISSFIPIYRFRRGLGGLVLLAFLEQAACSDVRVGPDVEQPAVQASPLSATRLRLMTANITSGDAQSYDPGDGVRIFLGTAPDVVMIQELNYEDNLPSAIHGLVDRAFGPDFSYYIEGSAQIPNGVISRYPMLGSGEWNDPYVENRDFAYARIDVPGPRDLWAVSVHLLTSRASVREREAESLVRFIESTIPEGDLLAIGGDFNTDTWAEPCLSTLGQVVTTGGPQPVDQDNNSNTNGSRSKPYDHILVDGDLGVYQTATVVGESSYTDGLVLDTRVYSPISEIAPARHDDSASRNMQHMAVIKDFLLPAEDLGVEAEAR